MNASPREYILDGRRFATLEEFYEEISRVLIPGAAWGRNLDAFNDILRGGFGTPDDGFRLRWKNASLSREKLGPKFDCLIEIIADHGAGGEQAEDRVELILDD
jgi:RNAse (barnase) inhibitor barstar